MNFQRELRRSKKIVRKWVRTRFSDEKLACVMAFNEDKRMSFRDPCACLMGVTYSSRLHTCEICDQEHYAHSRGVDLGQDGRLARILAWSEIGKAEKAYLFLGFSPTFNCCLGEDGLRRRRFSVLLRAEMRCREKIRATTPHGDPVYSRSGLSTF